jgi:hypothetical protein
MGTNVSTNFITCPADPKKTLGIKLPFLVMIIKNVQNILIASLKNILHSKYKCLMIRMFEGDLGHLIINLQRESNPSYALCR